MLHNFRRLTPSQLHTHPTPLSDAFSHPFTHKRPPPSSPSLLSLPVDTPNKATCVVSGCLGERSPCKPACHVYQGTISTPALCAALFCFPTPSHFHPLDLSFLPSILFRSSDPSYSFLSTPFLHSWHMIASLPISFYFILVTRPSIVNVHASLHSNKHDTSSVTHSLSHWLHTFYVFKTRSPVIHKAFLRSKPHWHTTEYLKPSKKPNWGGLWVKWQRGNLCQTLWPV